MASAEDTVLAYWAACEARDWDGFGTLLAADMVYDLPQTRERITGRADFVRFNREYPGDWHLRVVRVVGAGASAASWIAMSVAGEEVPATTFFDLDTAGSISRITDFWPEPYAAPAGREHLTERY